jgi:hypothetical protein
VKFFFPPALDEPERAKALVLGWGEIVPILVFIVAVILRICE